MELITIWMSRRGEITRNINKFKSWLCLSFLNLIRLEHMIEEMAPLMSFPN